MRDRMDWTGPVLDVVANYRRARPPTSGLNEFQIWRDRRLMSLAVQKREPDDRFGN